MEEIITKEEFDELMSLEGKVRASGVKNNTEFVFKEEGKDGLKRLEETMAKLDYPIKYRDIKPADFCPIGFLAVTLLVIKRLFNYDNKKFQEMGKFQARSSFITRVLMKFASIERSLKEVTKAWSRYNTIGELKIVEYDREKRYVILRIKNFRCHPLQCQIFIGLFSALPKMIIRTEATCEEIKCIHKGDEYHEFLIKW